MIYVAESSVLIHILQGTEGLILERNLTNVMSVAAALVERHTSQSIRVFIQKGNLSKTKTVENLSLDLNYHSTPGNKYKWEII